MELDRELLDQIRDMDDNALSEGVGKIAQNLGVDPGMAKRYLGDTAKIREAVANLTPEDLERITQALGKDTTAQLAEQIRREMKR